MSVGGFVEMVHFACLGASHGIHIALAWNDISLGISRMQTNNR
jgi:hypothetical protein